MKTCEFIKHRNSLGLDWYECELLNKLGITYLEVKKNCGINNCGLRKLLSACHAQRNRAIKAENNENV